MKNSFDSFVMQVIKVLRICMIHPADIVFLKFQRKFHIKDDWLVSMKCKVTLSCSFKYFRAALSRENREMISKSKFWPKLPKLAKNLRAGITGLGNDHH